jgi:cation diffusion facilitator family transporter
MGHDHAHAHDEKSRVAIWSLVASAGLTLIKLAAALTSGSLGLLSETFHSLFDFGATIITLVAVRFSHLPADDEHHFGHAKIESLAALVETFLLVGVTLWVAYEAVTRLVFGGHDVEISWWLFAVVIISIAVDYNRSHALEHTAKKTSSDALAADAMHFWADMLSSIAVLVGLFFTWLGFKYADALTALVVSVFIGKAAYGLGARALSTLLDEAPAGATEKLRGLAAGTKGVLRVKQLRVRPAGATLFVDVAVDVPRTLPSTEIEDIRQTLVKTMRKNFSQSDVAVQIHPVALDSETAFDKIELIAAQHGLSIHHLAVQDLDGKLAVSFDLEVEGSMPLHAAHDKATKLEDAIREGLGNNVEVESHIEPLDAVLLVGQPANERIVSRISKKLGALCKAEKQLSGLHNIRVRQHEAGHYVHYHCRFKSTQTINDVHAVIDRIENALIKVEPTIMRVVAHAEPVGSKRHRP